MNNRWRLAILILLLLAAHSIFWVREVITEDPTANIPEIPAIRVKKGSILTLAEDVGRGVPAGKIPAEIGVDPLLPEKNCALFILPLEQVKRGDTGGEELLASLKMPEETADQPDWMKALNPTGDEGNTKAKDLEEISPRNGGESVFTQGDTPQTIPLVFTGTLESGGALAAVIEDRDVDGVAYTRKPGEQFGDYTVMDVKMFQVMLKDLKTGRVFRLERHRPVLVRDHHE